MKKKNQLDHIEEDDNEQNNSLSEQSEEQDNGELKSGGDKKQAERSSPTITDYEKLRQNRIEENKAKLQALGLPALVSSLPQVKSKKQKKPNSQKSKTKQDDNDYQPSTEEEEEEQSDSSADEETQQKLPTPKKGTPAKRRPPGRPKGKKMKSLSSLTVDKASKEHASLPVDDKLDKKIASLQDDLDDDAALQQALALSIGVSMEDAAAIAEASRQDSEVGKSKTKVDNSELGGKGKAKAEVEKTPCGKRQRKQTKNVNTIKLSEDEVLAYFFYFDEVGKGKITVRDLERVALAHDFTWTKQELTEMINAFDKDHDGQLNLDDFQAIAARCNMIGGT